MVNWKCERPSQNISRSRCRRTKVGGDIGTLTYLVGYDETFEVVENGLIQYQDRQAFDHDDRTNFGK